MAGEEKLIYKVRLGVCLLSRENSLKSSCLDSDFSRFSRCRHTPKLGLTHIIDSGCTQDRSAQSFQIPDPPPFFRRERERAHRDPPTSVDKKRGPAKTPTIDRLSLRSILSLPFLTKKGDIVRTSSGHRPKREGVKVTPNRGIRPPAIHRRFREAHQRLIK